MDSFRKDTEVVVEEENQDEDYSCKNAKLDNRPDLSKSVSDNASSGGLVVSLQSCESFFWLDLKLFSFQGMIRCLWIILPGGEDCQLDMPAIKNDDLFRINLAEALLLLLVLKLFSNAADLISSPTHWTLWKTTEDQTADYIIPVSPGVYFARCRGSA